MGILVLEQFIEYLQFQRKMSSHTCIAYKNDLEDFFRFIRTEFDIADDNFTAITNDIVRSWVSELISNGLKPISVRRKASSLRSFFKFLRKEKIVDASPITNLPQLKISKKLPILISVDSMDAIFDSMPPNPTYEEYLDYLIVYILYGTGIRRAELISLKENHVDLNLRQIKVFGKRSKERIVPITPELAEQMQGFMEVKRNEGIQSENLLVKRNLTNLYPGYIYKVVKMFLTLHKVNGKRSPHNLRHTYATRLLQNGAELLSVKELLGHSSLASTQVYTQVNIEDLKKVYKKNHPKQ